MPADHTFSEFLSRLRAGDADAAAALVREYEPMIRREVRMRLTDPRLYRLFDSMDICQSVLLSFFVRAAAGQYELEQPRDLANLLITMAYHKVISRSRKLQRQGAAKFLAGAEDLELLDKVPDRRPGPDRIVAGRDLFQEVQRRLTDEERVLAERRAVGRTWPAISAELGGTPEGRRKQLARALDRVLRQLGLEEGETAGGTHE